MRLKPCHPSLEQGNRLASNWAPALDRTDLTEVLEEWNAIRMLNHLHESNPEIDMQNLTAQSPLGVLEVLSAGRAMIGRQWKT